MDSIVGVVSRPGGYLIHNEMTICTKEVDFWLTSLFHIYINIHIHKIICLLFTPFMIFFRSKFAVFVRILYVFVVVCCVGSKFIPTILHPVLQNTSKFSGDPSIFYINNRPSMNLCG